MFQHTLDERKNILDQDGNLIVDLFPSIFDFNVEKIKNYNVYRIGDGYQMRPDLISLKHYKTTDRTETILLFSGISNPFTIDKDDIIMVPNPAEFDGQLRNLNDDIGDNGINESLALKNAYKYISEKKFPKYDNEGNLRFDRTKIGDSSIKKGDQPYIVDNDAPAVTVSNGRIYFGTNTGLLTPNDIPTSNIDAKIEKLVNQALGMIDPSSGTGSGSGNNPGSGNSGSGSGGNGSGGSGNGSGSGNSGSGGSGDGSPSDNLCESINCGNNSCTTDNCLSSGTTLSDLLKGSNTVL